MEMKKTISFVTLGLQFNGNSLVEKSLGGSESAMIYLARELAALGNEVTVYCDCDKPGLYDNVEYRSYELFNNDEKFQTDVCIVSRYTEFLAKPLDSKLNILWTHDIFIDNPQLSISVADKIFCLSEYHKKYFQESYKLEDDAFWITSNGFDQSLVSEIIPYEQKKNNYIYSARFERGLIKLLEDIWPKILEKNPDAKLNICGYQNALANYQPGTTFHEVFKHSNELLSISKNIVDRGTLSKQEYYKLLNQCAYMIYPTDCRGETSCINAMEAQASGCLVITTDDYALAETVKSNTKIPHGDDYDTEFLAMLDYYIDDVYEQEVIKAKNLIQPYNWKTVAKSWDDKINSLFIERSNNNKQAILDQLVYYSDIVAAREISNEQKYIDLVKKGIKDNNIDDTYVHREYHPPRLDAILDIIKTKIPHYDYKLRVLDLGCHDGVISIPLLEKYGLYIDELTAYDGCTPALEYLDSNYSDKFPQLNIINDDVLNINNYTLDVNVVIVGELLEHIEDTVGFLDNLMTLVKSNCTFIFTTPTGPWDNVEAHKTITEHIHHFELNDIKEIFKDTNITIHKSFNTGTGRRMEVLSNYIYTFTVEPDNIPSFYKPDYNDKFIKTRPYKKVSASMIVKNEENNLARCLKSIYDLVDEIVIVDTGSTDDTKRIASKYTDKIYDYKWEEDDGLGDFSKARNYSLSKCTGDYILWMDADEELINGRQLFQFIVSDYYNSILVKQRHCIVYGDNNEYDPPYHDRLFKNNGIYFTGVVHEYPTTDEGWISKCLFQDATFIAHYGTINRPVRHEKIEDRYYDLIIKNYNQRPDFVMAQYYYMGLLCSITQKHGDLSNLDKIFDLWYNNLLPTEDMWLLRNGGNFIQSLYKTLYANEIINLPNGILENRQFENDGGVILDIVAPAHEFQMFLDIFSNLKVIR
jgi:glycosyltransferase involved in cell wall biosynthesis/2-polyprenyl-3-methyl-5-hydroxy-6-metoxy-1,4-benzoquinol methylase